MLKVSLSGTRPLVTSGKSLFGVVELEKLTSLVEKPLSRKVRSLESEDRPLNGGEGRNEMCGRQMGDGVDTSVVL